MGFSRLEYWSGLPCPPGELPDLGMESVSPVAFALQPDSLQLSHQGRPAEVQVTEKLTGGATVQVL